MSLQSWEKRAEDFCVVRWTEELESVARESKINNNYIFFGSRTRSQDLLLLPGAAFMDTRVDHGSRLLSADTS